MSRHGEETTDSEKIAAILVHITYLREDYASLRKIVAKHLEDEGERLGKVERRLAWMLGVGSIMGILLAGATTLPRFWE